MSELEGIRRLIVDHIHSVDHLEVLLLLWEHRDREWSAEEVSRTLRTSSNAAQLRLTDLAAGGFLSRQGEGEPRYRYAVKTPDVDTNIKKLAEAYRTHRLSIIQMIYEKPARDIRSFLDAFRIRDDKNEE